MAEKCRTEGRDRGINTSSTHQSLPIKNYLANIIKKQKQTKPNMYIVQIKN